MKILRLRLKNFRGVAECELEFLAQGVTVIQGPNEAGKSSLAEAIDLLFDFRSDSKSRRVKAVQPVGRDVGSEVEVELRAGEVRFVYFKRFNRDHATRLDLLAPSVETLVGREAHAKANQLLEEAMDVTLWKALRIQQGAGLEPAKVHGSSSLVAALDHAAQSAEGAESNADAARGEGLFARVVEQYERYYTPGKGKERGNLTAARKEVEQLEADRRRLAGQLAELAAEVEEMATLRAIGGQLSEALTKAESDAAGHREGLAKVDSMAQKIEGLERRQGESAEEEKLWAQLAQLESQQSQHAERAVTLGERAESAARSLEPLEERQRQAKDHLTLAGEIVALRRRDEAHFALASQARGLRSTAERAAEASARVAKLSARLAEFWIDDERLAPIEHAARAVTTAEGALAGGSPHLRVKALADLELAVDGETQAMTAGEKFEQQTANALHLRVAEVVEIEIEPGAGVEELRSTLSRRRWELERRCSEAGVASAREARNVADQRRRVQLELATAKEARQRALDGEDAEQIEELLTELDGEIKGYLDGRRSLPAMAQGAEAARADREAAETSLDEARLRLDHCQEKLNEGRRDHQESALELKEAVAEAARVEQQMEWARGQLGEDRFDLGTGEGSSGPSLAIRAREALEAAALAASEARQAAARLLDEQPEMVRVLSQRSEEVLRAAKEQLVENQRRLHGLEERLKALGEGGLEEKRDDARQRLAAAIRERDDLLRRAAAAGALYRAMSQAREASRAAYHGPLSGKIEALGRRVFGRRFAVELDDDLRISRRILDGTALPVEALSAGAREQLAILFRLACALLVSQDGGVPLILDDSLGHADPRRLAAMSEVLNEVGRHCQVLIFTAWPDRFAGVESARQINFGTVDSPG